MYWGPIHQLFQMNFDDFKLEIRDCMIDIFPYHFLNGIQQFQDSRSLISIDYCELNINGGENRMIKMAAYNLKLDIIKYEKNETIKIILE